MKAILCALCALLLLSAASSPPAPLLAVLAVDELLLIDPDKLEITQTIDDLDEPKAFAFSPDRQWLATTRPGRDRVQLLDLAKGKTLDLEGPTLVGPVGVAFGKDRLYVLSSTLKALVELDPALGKVERVLALLGPEPSGLIPKPNSDSLLVVSEAGLLAEVDTRLWTVVRHDKLADPILAAAWSGDGLLVATPSAVKLLDAARERSLSLPESAVGVAGPGLVLTRQELIRLDPESGQVVWRLAVGSHPIGVIASADGSRAFVADSESRDLQVVDLEAGAERTRMALKRVPTGLRWIR